MRVIKWKNLSSILGAESHRSVNMLRLGASFLYTFPLLKIDKCWFLINLYFFYYQLPFSYNIEKEFRKKKKTNLELEVSMCLKRKLITIMSNILKSCGK